MERLETGLPKMGASTATQYLQGVRRLYGGFTNQVLYKIINDTCDKYGNMREGQIQDITEACERCVAECAKETRKLIDDCQPAKFL